MSLKKKFSLSQLFSVWILLVLILTSCETNSSEVKVNTPTATPVIPTSTSLPMVEPSPTPLPQFPLDGYLVVFNKDGDLYFQDETDSPIQLTHSGESSHSPILSDDNMKIVFIRGEDSVNTFAYSNIYSVNPDGSKEQALITPEWLATFGEGMGVRFLSFLSGTHQLRFEVCESKEYKSPCLANFFLLDVDTGEIKESSYNYFHPSPDGKMILDTSSGYITIVDMNSNVIRKNILPYKVTSPITIYPDIQWLPDSSGLIVAFPVSEQLSVYVGNLAYTVWRYTLDDNVLIQMPLDPPPTLTYASCAEVISESPDGKWGLYNSAEPGLYIWNLSDGNTQSYALGGCSQPVWSADSQHFIYGGSGNPYFLGSINEAPIPIDGIFMKWIDGRHFLYADITDKSILKTRVGEIVEGSILKYDLGPYLLIKPK